MGERIIPILLGAAFFLPFLGGVHLFDWDEINFAECAREMIATGNYAQVQINFEPFWEKPPLFIWLQALSMHLFGVGEYAARFPNAVCGILTLALLYRIGNRLHGKPFGLLWSMAYFGSLLPHLYFKSGIIDPWFNLFIFLGFYYFVSERKYVLSGLFLGLAILTKGPVGLLIPALVAGAYWIKVRFRWYARPQDFLVVLLAALAVPALWFGYDIWQNGPWFAEQFIRYQIRLFSTPDAGHGGFPGYHVVVLLLGCFPASIFAIPALWRPQLEDERARELRWWMAALFWVVLVLFSVVQSKIVHYSSLAYFPLTYLAATTLCRRIQDGLVLSNALRWGVTGLGIFIGLAAIAIALAGQNIDAIEPLFAKDPFALANLEAEVSWTGWEVLPGLWMLALSAWWAWAASSALSQKKIFALFIGGALFLQLGLFFFAGRVEGYSQRAAVEFYKTLQDRPANVRTVGFKSYAHLFYARIQPGEGEDRPRYLVTKIHKTARLLETYDTAEELYRKNGFVFYQIK